MPALILILIYTVSFILFWLPGLFLAACALPRRQFPPSALPLLAAVCSALLGYACFWVYFFSPAAGRLTSTALVLLAAGSLLALLPRASRFRQFLASGDVLPPLTLTFLVGLFYLAIVFAVDLRAYPERQVLDRFPAVVVLHDHIIPLIVAERAYGGEGLRDAFIMLDHRSSDRPPLQAGLVLMQGPLPSWTGQPVGLHYQALGTVIQCTWVAAAWLLCRLARLDGARLALVLALLVFSGFFYLHSVFLWPKMLAGALTTSAVALLFLQPPSWPQVIAGAVAAALGILAHGGVVFTLMALALVLLLPGRFLGVGKIVAGCAVFAALMLPWIAYQRFYDPPGNRLVKLHLAGVDRVDDRSAMQAIRDSYAAQGFGGVLVNKWENVKQLVGTPLVGDDYRPPTALGRWRYGEYVSFFKALGVLNVGWLLWLLHLGRGWGAGPAPAAASKMLTLASLALLVWVALLFGPATTIINHGSYATMILVYTGLAILLVSTRLALRALLCGLAFLDFAVVWLLAVPDRAASVPSVHLLAIATFLALVICLVWLARQLPDEQAPAASL